MPLVVGQFALHRLNPVPPCADKLLIKGGTDFRPGPPTRRAGGAGMIPLRQAARALNPHAGRRKNRVRMLLRQKGSQMSLCLEWDRRNAGQRPPLVCSRSVVLVSEKSRANARPASTLPVQFEGVRRPNVVVFGWCGGQRKAAVELQPAENAVAEFRAHPPAPPRQQATVITVNGIARLADHQTCRAALGALSYLISHTLPLDFTGVCSTPGSR